MSKNKTQFFKFTGPVKWAKVYEPDVFRGASRWTIDQYLDEDNLARRKEAGIQSKVKSDELGEYVQYKRNTSAIFDGKVNEFHPPIIFNKDGSKAVWYELNEARDAFIQKGDRILIGNGSICEVTVSVYPTQGFGNGQRLESIRIIDLIEYVREDSGPSTPNSIVKGNTAPAKTPWD